MGGYRVVVVSDISGMIHDPNGTDVPRLVMDMRGKDKIADLKKEGEGHAGSRCRIRDKNRYSK